MPGLRYQEMESGSQKIKMLGKFLGDNYLPLHWNETVKRVKLMVFNPVLHHNQNTCSFRALHPEWCKPCLYVRNENLLMCFLLVWFLSLIVGWQWKEAKEGGYHISHADQMPIWKHDPQTCSVLLVVISLSVKRVLPFFEFFFCLSNCTLPFNC